MFKLKGRNWSVAEEFEKLAMRLMVIWFAELILSIACSKRIATWTTFACAVAAITVVAIAIVLIAGKLYEEYDKYGW